MSLQVLTQGGAGGASASIQVNGLSETDSVKAVQKIKNVIENPDYKEYRVLKGQLALGDVAVGETVRLNVSGVATEFIVVNQGKPSDLYDDSCDGTWLLMKGIEQGSTWNNSNYSGNSYGSSAVHRYLNSTFLGTLDAGIQSVVIQAKIPYVNGTGSGGSVASGSNGLSAKVFLLSGYEVGFTTSDDSRFPIDGSKLSYFLSGSGTSANNKRIAYLNGNDDYSWWLRSPYTAGTEMVFLVNDQGMKGQSLPSPKRNRPAMILPTNLSVKDGFIDGTEVQQGKLLSSASVGDIVKMNVGGTPTEFIVVQQGNPDSSLYDESCDGAWLLMKDIHNTAMYTTIGNASYNFAMIQNSLSIFLGKLDENVLNAVKTVKIPYLEIEGAKNDIKRTLFSGTEGLSTKAFLLSVYEVDPSRTGSPKDGTCLDYFKSASTSDRIASFEGTTTAWWTRTGWGTYADTQSYLVGDNGSTSTTSVKTYCGVRPAIILPGDTIITDDFIGGSISEPSSVETYTPLEYIESTGTQYIDTGYLPQQHDEVSAKFEMTEILEYNRLIGAATGSSGAAYYGCNPITQLNGYFDIGYYNWYRPNSIPCEKDTIYDYYASLSDGSQEYTINDANMSGDLTGFVEIPCSYFVFSVNHDGSPEWGSSESSCCPAKLYGLSISNNSVLIRNFVPAKRNSDGVLGLFDTVNSVFYTNAGTGDFVAGPEVSQYIEAVVDGRTVNGRWVDMINPEYVELPVTENEAIDGYTRLEYIESSGTQYIDTGFTPSSARSFKFSFDAAFLSETNAIYGTGRSYAGFYSSPSIAQFALYQTIVQISSVSYDTNKHHFVLDGVNLTATIDDNSASIPYSSGSPSDYTWVLFGYSHASFNASRLWGAQIEENGVLVRNFIPARRDSDSVVGLYDLVNGVFYTNAGSGEFVAGEELSQFTKEYIQLEYIESTGTQYIDTGYKPNTNTKLEIGASTTDTTNDKPLFGVRKSNGVDGFLCWFNPQVAEQPGFAVGSMSNTYTSYGIATGVRYDVTLSNSLFTMNELSYPFDAQTFTSSYNLYLLALNKADVLDNRLFYGRLYYTRIYESDVLVRDYVPVKRVSDGAIGLYDKVNQTFYSNAGTGNFTAGAEVPESFSYFLISPIKAYGTWEVGTTSSVSINNQNVDIDEATIFNLDFVKLVRFTTDFTAKGDDWIEEGGTFTFNPATAAYPGLYQAEGSTQFGTLTTYDSTEWKAKRLIIPLGGSLETFHAETECFWVSSDANRMGRLMLCFQDEDGNFLFHIIINDGWGRSNSISIAYFNALNSNLLKFVDAVSVSPYNNVPLRFTLDYDGNKMNIGFSYNGGGFSYKSETYAFPAIANAVVYFAYYPTSNPTPLMNIRSLTVEQA